MKITVSNITSEYPKITATLPAALNEEEFSFVKENIDLYNDEKSIKDYIDAFVAKLNQVLAKEDAGKGTKKSGGSTSPGKKTTSGKKKSTSSGKKTTSAKKKTTTKKTTSSRKKTTAKKTTAKKPAPAKVERVDDEIKFIKRFVLLNNKVKTREQLLNFLNAIQKAIVEKRIRKSSKYADEIMYIQKSLVKLINSTSTQVKVDISESKMDELKPVAYSEKVRPSVAYIKRYIGVHGKDGVKLRSRRLLTAIEAAKKRGDITSSDPYYDRIQTIIRSLKDYVNRDNALNLNDSELRGLEGIAGMRAVKKKVIKSTARPKIKFTKMKMPNLSGFVTADTRVKPPETFILPGELGRFLGEMQKYMLAIKIEGESHSGKTQMAYQIANGLIYKGYKVGACDFEQGGLESKDTHKTIERNISPANRKYLAVSGQIPEGDRLAKVKEYARHFDVLLLDSWQSLKQITTQRFNELREEVPDTIFIVIFQHNAQGTTKGGASSQFDAPVAINCHLVRQDFPRYNYAELTKNRGNDGIHENYFNIVEKKVYKGEPNLPASAPAE